MDPDEVVGLSEDESDSIDDSHHINNVANNFRSNTISPQNRSTKTIKSPFPSITKISKLSISGPDNISTNPSNNKPNTRLQRRQ